MGVPYDQLRELIALRAGRALVEVAELEATLDAERAKHAEQLAALQAELDRLRAAVPTVNVTTDQP